MGVAGQLVPSNPAISSVYLLPAAAESGSTMPSVRIPPNVSQTAASCVPLKRRVLTQRRRFRQWSFAIAFSHSTFLSPTSPPAASLTYSASLVPARGNSLPPWLAFDPVGLFFSGLAPPSTGVWQVQLCGQERADASVITAIAAICESFELVVSATVRPGEVLAGSDTAPSSVSSFRSTSSLSTAAPSPSASLPPAPTAARTLQRLNVTASAALLHSWTPLTAELATILLDGEEQSIAVDCSAVEGLVWSDRCAFLTRLACARPLTVRVSLLRTGFFTGNIGTGLVTDESYPATPWTTSRSPLALPVVVTYSNGSSVAFTLPLSVYPSLLPSGPAYETDATATPGQPLVLDVASDAINAAVGSRPQLSASFEPREAGSWLSFDASSGRLTATSGTGATAPNGVVPTSLAYASVVITVEARDSITNAVSHRQRTINVVPNRPEDGLYPGLTLTGMRLFGVVIGSLAALALLILLVYLSRRPKTRARWTAALRTTSTRRRLGQEDDSPPADLVLPGPRQMVQHAHLTEIAELKYDSERGAFDTTGQTPELVNDGGRSSPSDSLPYSTSLTTASSARVARPSIGTLSVAVGRIVSVARRVISGSTVSTKVGSVNEPTKQPALPTTTTATTYSQETMSTYLYVYSVRGRPIGDGSSVSSSGSISSLGTPLPPPPQAARLADDRTNLPSPAAALIAVVHRQVSSDSASPEPPNFDSPELTRASWESPTTYEWSAKSRKSTYSRPSNETPASDPQPVGESSDISLPSFYGSGSIARRLSTDKPSLLSSSSSHSHERAVISRAERASSSCAMHVRVSGAPSSLHSAFALGPLALAPATIVVNDGELAETQRLTTAGATSASTVAVESTVSLAGLAAALDGELDRSFIIDLSDDRFGSEYSSSGGSFEAFYPIDGVPTIVPYVNDSFASLGPQRSRSYPDFSPVPSSADLSVAKTSSVRYEARLNQPFVIHPVFDLSFAPKRPGVVRALRCTTVGPEPLPPWIAFRGGVFEGMPMDGDEGDWEFVVVRRRLWPTLILHPLLLTCPSAPRSPGGHVGRPPALRLHPPRQPNVARLIALQPISLGPVYLVSRPAALGLVDRPGLLDALWPLGVPDLADAGAEGVAVVGGRRTEARPPASGDARSQAALPRRCGRRRLRLPHFLPSSPSSSTRPIRSSRYPVALVPSICPARSLLAHHSPLLPFCMPPARRRSRVISIMRAARQEPAVPARPRPVGCIRCGN